ncbi:hypothetical protein BN1723_016946 [Verticillium longisporum]|uniref:Uncharacterized protein n=1 Tax=Verticillium longisporum TaxID=100787 RepID=A0A0G4NQZ7_VERLO|nr:hypothetical protein BN1723_016946 [Verticillium longisporum]
MASLRTASRSLELWLLLIPFAFYVGFFNSCSSLLNQMLNPYGLSDDEAGIGGALLIVVGLVVAAITSPILDRTKAFLLSIRRNVLQCDRDVDQLALDGIPLLLCRHFARDHQDPAHGAQALHHGRRRPRAYRQLGALRRIAFEQGGHLWRRHVWPDPDRPRPALCSGGADSVLGHVVFEPWPRRRHCSHELGEPLWSRHRSARGALHG